MSIGLILAFFLVLLALFLLRQGRREQQRAGLPLGRLLYTDLHPLHPAERVLFDPHTGLSGKPDYVIQQGDILIPVEVKTREAPLQPYLGHIYQILAYCLLVESHTGRRPPYGVLRYRNRTFAVDYTPQAEQTLRNLLAEMQSATASTLVRSHNDATRCARCGYRAHCDQHL